MGRNQEWKPGCLVFHSSHAPILAYLEKDQRDMSHQFREGTLEIFTRLRYYELLFSRLGSIFRNHLWGGQGGEVLRAIKGNQMGLQWGDLCRR